MTTSDKIVIGLGLGQMVFDMIFGLLMFWMANKTSKITALEEQLGNTATKLVDQKFSLVSVELNGSIRMLTEQVHEINERLEKGGRAFRHAAERDHELELKLVKALDSLKDFMRDQFADRAGQQAMQDQICNLQTSVATLNAKQAGPAL